MDNIKERRWARDIHQMNHAYESAQNSVENKIRLKKTYTEFREKFPASLHNESSVVVEASLQEHHSRNIRRYAELRETMIDRYGKKIMKDFPAPEEFLPQDMMEEIFETNSL